jgi:hypothetical protein
MRSASVRITPSLFRAMVASMAYFGGFHIAAAEVSPQAAPIRPGAPSCAEDCNRKASDCLDGCEDRFKTDDRARVTCKFECTNQRQQCEKDCG